VATRSIKDVDFSGKRVFVRVDFNVPIKNEPGGQNPKIADDTRIKGALPTINYLLEHGATVILASHLGRPKGKPNPEFTLKPVADYLSKLLNRPVAFATDCIGAPAKNAEAAHRGGVVLLENLRFHAEEEANDEGFSKELASLCDVYVNDAFGSAHRAHASTEGITHHVKDSVAGFLMAAEVEYLGKALDNPDRPFVAILGGAKVSDKLEVIENLLGKVDALLIAGAMAYTFFRAPGLPIGKSLPKPRPVSPAGGPPAIDAPPPGAPTPRRARAKCPRHGHEGPSSAPPSSRRRQIPRWPRPVRRRTACACWRPSCARWKHCRLTAA